MTVPWPSPYSSTITVLVRRRTYGGSSASRAGCCARAESSPDGKYLNVRVALPGTSLGEVATLDSVVNVEPWVAPELFGERQDQIMAGNLDASLQSPTGPGYLAWLSANGFSTTTADYPVVVVVDDGVDDGTTSPITTEFYELNSTGNPSRLSFSVIPPGSSASGPEGPDGHGHINASIVGGYNADTGAAVEDAAGFNYGLGIAPYGPMANVRIFAPGFDVGFGDTTMVDDYYGRGGRISSNSWGADVGGAYTVDAQTYDGLARDASTSLSGNQEMLFVFAAGNAGPGAGTVGSPATAKNVLSVGASETSNPDASSGDGCGDGASDGDDARDMASFSSRGPTDDGRAKPDIVAPGVFIQGNASQPLASFNGSGVCGAATNDQTLPGTDALFPPGTIYTWSAGTSHSTPAVAGYASLITEHVARVHSIATPSPALLRAYVIHAARHLTGSGAGENLPGDNQGFGFADMGLGFESTAPRHLVDQTTVFGGSGETFRVDGQAVDPTEPIRVALVWTDAPGPTVGNAFVNDLDLTVQVGGSTYLGNNFLLGESQTGGSADTVNNTEAVFLSAGPSGLMSIIVDATTIAGDGVPGNADATDQDFAIVAYNFSTTIAAGTIALDREEYNCADTLGLTVADSDLAGDGTASVTVTTTGGDSETVVLTETGASTGVFTGAVSTATGTVTTEDGTVQVAEGETITGTYNDADDGTGSPAVVQNTASVDCTAPVISNVQSSAVASTSATVSFDTDETATGQVRYGTSCASLGDTASTGAAGTSHTAALFGLTPLTTYFYAADATDPAQNAATDDNGSLCHSFTTLEQGDYFTEAFTSADNDLDNHSLTLTPDGSGSFYSACRSSVSAFSIDPSGGTPLPLGDDSAALVALTGGETVSFYGTSHATLFVGSNGYITFGSADTDFDESLTDHFALARIAPLFDDFDPSSGGDVTYQQLVDRLVVTWDRVPEFNQSSESSFQVELFFDGVIRITYLTMSSSDGIAGISEGNGIPSDFAESDLTGYAACPPPPPLCAPTPEVGCREGEPGRSRIQIRDREDDDRDRFSWRMAKADATLLSDFADPVNNPVGTHRVCIYDASASPQPLFEADVPPMGSCFGRPCWKNSGSTGYKYKDREETPDGVTDVKLKAGGAGKARVQVKARGPNFFHPAPPLTLPVAVQYVIDDGVTTTCWQTVFTEVTRNEGEHFKAKGP